MWPLRVCEVRLFLICFTSFRNPWKPCKTRVWILQYLNLERKRVCIHLFGVMSCEEKNNKRRKKRLLSKQSFDMNAPLHQSVESGKVCTFRFGEVIENRTSIVKTQLLNLVLFLFNFLLDDTLLLHTSTA